VSESKPVQFNGSSLSVEDICALAHGEARAVLADDAAFRRRIDKGAELIDALIAKDGVVYGVTTGFGDNVTVAVGRELAPILPAKLVRYHGVGLGADFGPEETRAILAARLASLARGYSGVSYELLERLAGLLGADVLPRVPEEGSVGASGDLTPLSYVAAVLCGEREAYAQGGLRPAAEALAQAGLKPYRLRPKEGLALMNGTAVMTALACLNFERARNLAWSAARVTSLAVLGLDGNPDHFSEGLFLAKPFQGMGAVAARIRADLAAAGKAEHSGRLQDRYSIRCAPHVIGVLEDSLPWLRGFIEQELNSSNDNPLVDAEAGLIHHGGHFYGGHICAAMDAMKTAVANLADLLDRQIALLVDPRFNNGLPSNLCGATGPSAAAEHGLKALQITASACTAEALKLCMPASVFSRSTESHNQDKVSLGTIAARDCRRVLELTEQVAACAALTAVQAVDLRLKGAPLRGPLQEARAWVRSVSPFVSEDRALEADLRALALGLRRGVPALAGGRA
jgi:histidine ammonia-lyase